MENQESIAKPLATEAPATGARFPLRFQVLAPISITMLATLVIISALTAGIAARRAAARVDADVARIATTLRTTSFPLTRPVLDNIAGLSGAQLVLTNSDNRVTSSTSEVARSAWRPAEHARGELAAEPDRIELNGEGYFHRVVELTRPVAGSGSTYLHVFYPESAWRQARREAVFPPLVIGGIGAIVMAAVSMVLARRVTRPISRIAELMGDLANGNYVPAVIPYRNDELRDLTLAANQLAVQLDELHGIIRRSERLTLLGQLSSGLAHQMRNSATGARLAMQLHRRSCRTGDRESIDVALRQLELVEEQLVGFLTLGKPEDPRQVDCDLAAIVEDVGRLLAPNCRHRGIELLWQVPDVGCHAIGDGGQLRQALINLTLNALDAADRGGRVRLALEQQAGLVRFAVYDTGPGVRPEFAESLWEAFVTSKPEGVGLGLAVVNRIASAHGGQVRYQRDSGETCFELLLPHPLSQPAVNASAAADPLSATPHELNESKETLHV